MHAPFRSVVPNRLYICHRKGFRTVAEKLGGGKGGQGSGSDSTVRVVCVSAAGAESTRAAEVGIGDKGASVAGLERFSICGVSPDGAAFDAFAKSLEPVLAALAPAACVPPSARFLLVDVDERGPGGLMVGPVVLVAFMMRHMHASLWDAYRALGVCDLVASALASLDRAVWALLGRFEESEHGVGTLVMVLAHVSASPAEEGEGPLHLVSDIGLFNFLGWSQSVRKRHNQKLLIMDARDKPDFERGHLRFDAAGLAAENVPISAEAGAALPDPDAIAQRVENRMQRLQWKSWRLRNVFLYASEPHDRVRALARAMGGHKGGGRVIVLGASFQRFADRYPFLVKPSPKTRFLRRRPQQAWYPFEIIPGFLYLWDCRVADRNLGLLSDLKISHVVVVGDGQSARNELKTARLETVQISMDSDGLRRAAALRSSGARVVVWAGSADADERRDAETFAISLMMLVRGCGAVELAQRLVTEMSIVANPDWDRVESLLDQTMHDPFARDDSRYDMACVVDRLLYVAPAPAANDLALLGRLGVTRVVVASTGVRVERFPARADYFSFDFDQSDADTVFLLVHTFVSAATVEAAAVEAKRKARTNDEKCAGPSSPHPTSPRPTSPRVPGPAVLLVGSHQATSALATAYLMRSAALGALEAYEQVLARAPGLRVSLSGARALQDFESFLVEKKVLADAERRTIPPHLCSDRAHHHGETRRASKPRESGAMYIDKPIAQRTSTGAYGRADPNVEQRRTQLRARGVKAVAFDLHAEIEYLNKKCTALSRRAAAGDVEVQDLTEELERKNMQIKMLRDEVQEVTQERDSLKLEAKQTNHTIAVFGQDDDEDDENQSGSVVFGRGDQDDEDNKDSGSVTFGGSASDDDDDDHADASSADASPVNDIMAAVAAARAEAAAEAAAEAEDGDGDGGDADTTPVSSSADLKSEMKELKAYNERLEAEAEAAAHAQATLKTRLEGVNAELKAQQRAFGELLRAKDNKDNEISALVERLKGEAQSRKTPSLSERLCSGTLFGFIFASLILILAFFYLVAVDEVY